MRMGGVIQTTKWFTY